MTAPELLTARQVAERLGVHTDDVRRWVRHEDCPVVQMGRKIRIPAAWADDPKGWVR